MPMSNADSPTPPPLPPGRKTWHFSLRSLMIGMTSFAILFGLGAILPYAFSQVLTGLVWIMASGWLVTGLFFARGDQRAFCIGAAVVVSSMWSRIGGRFLQGVFQIFGLFFGGIDLPSGVTAWLDLSLIVVTAVANGYLCIYARRYFERESSR